MIVDLSVVIPAFNEEARLGPTLERLAAFLATTGRSWEILVVDDGSSDGTAALCRRLAASSLFVGLVARNTSVTTNEGIAIFADLGPAQTFALAPPLPAAAIVESADQRAPQSAQADGAGVQGTGPRAAASSSPPPRNWREG